jgi:putative ABC transport system permease protein
MLNNLKVSLFLAYKSITKGNKGTLILTIFIMSLVFVNLVFIASLFLGINDALNNQIINTLYSNVVIEPKKDEKYISDVYSLKQKINSVPGVVGISAQYVTGAVFSFKDKSGSWSVKSINPDDADKVSTIHNSMIDGEYLSKLDTNEIILGKEIPSGYGGVLAEISSLGDVRVGDSINVIFNNGVNKSYHVKGVFDTGFQFANSNAYISQREMESVLGLNDKASQILIKTEDRGNEDRYVIEFLELGIKENINPWTVYTATLAAEISSFNQISILISAIGLFVASVTIFIIIYTSTISKRRQIGILRAVGIKESIVIYSYIFQAMFIVICGTIIGLFIMFFAVEPLFILHPLKTGVGFVSLVLAPKNILIDVASLIIVALFAGFVPSWMAVRQTILDAIWGD